MLIRIRAGGYAWIATATGVSFMDCLLIYKHKSTMSEVFGEALKHPLKRWPVIVAWTILTIHLFSCICPKWVLKLKKLDPMTILAEVLNKKWIDDKLAK